MRELRQRFGVSMVALALTACGSSQEERTVPDDEVHFEDEHPGDRYPASPAVQRAEAYLLEGDADRAKVELEGWIAQNHDDPRAHLDLGLAAVMLHDADGAEFAYREALRIAPEFADAMNNLALVLRARDRLDEALELLERAVRLRPDYVEAQTNLGLVREEKGDLEGAVQAYQRAADLDRENVMVRVNLGLALLGLSRTDDAKRELRGVLEDAERANDVAALGAIGNGLRRAGEPQLAVRAMRRAIDARGEEGPTPALLSELALAERAAGDRTSAEATLARAIQLDPRYATAHYLLANMQAGRGAFDDAIRNYRRALELEPDAPFAAEARERMEQARRAARERR